MKLLPFIHYQRYLGLTDIDYSTLRRCYVLNGNWMSYCSQVFILILLAAGLVEAFLRIDNIYLDMKSIMGNIYQRFLVLAIPITQIFVSIWMRFQQQVQLVLLQKLSKLTIRLQLQTENLPRPRLLFRLGLGLWAYYTCLILGFCLFVWNPHGYWSYNLSFACFYVLTIRSSFLIVYYTGLVHEVLVLLQAQADQLQSILDSSQICVEDLLGNLCIYDELLLICEQEIVQLFSVALIMIFFFFLLDATSILYLTTLQKSHSVFTILRLLVWTIPLSLKQCMPLTVNNLKRQVSGKRI